MRLRTRGDERGSVIIEFALVAPLLLMIVMGVIDFGWMIDRNNMVNNVSRDAARVASLDGSYQQVSDTVTNELDSVGIDPQDVVVTITCASPSGTSCTANSAVSYDATAVSGSTVSVTIAYTHHWLTPIGSLCSIFGGDCAGSSIVLTRTAEMVRE